jgi:hypothetical protein
LAISFGSNLPAGSRGTDSVIFALPAAAVTRSRNPTQRN